MKRFFEFGMYMYFPNEDSDVKCSFMVSFDLDENNNKDQNCEIIAKKCVEFWKRLKDVDSRFDDWEEAYNINIYIIEQQLVPFTDNISVYKEIYNYTSNQEIVTDKLIDEIFSL